MHQGTALQCNNRVNARLKYRYVTTSVILVMNFQL